MIIFLWNKGTSFDVTKPIVTSDLFCSHTGKPLGTRAEPPPLAVTTSRLVQPAVPTAAGTGLVQPVAKPVAKPTQDEKAENPFTKSILDEVSHYKIIYTRKEHCVAKTDVNFLFKNWVNVKNAYDTKGRSRIHPQMYHHHTITFYWWDSANDVRKCFLPINILWKWPSVH